MTIVNKNDQSNAPGLDIPAEVVKTDKNKTKKKNKNSKIFIFTLILIVLLIIAGYLVDKYTSINLLGSLSKNNNIELSDDYSAIFLSNGQVYFGVINNKSDDYTILKDIYYLQVSGALQQASPNETNQPQPQLTLVKLGNELHGPEDYMQINNDHIIFVEKLKKDGKVVEAIKQYKTGDEAAPVK